MTRNRALSPQALAVLCVLEGAPEEWHHGYELMARAEVKSGTLYPLLMRLEEQGLLEAQWAQSTLPGRPARHVYRLTSSGRQWVAEQAQALTAHRAQMPLRAAKVRA